MGKNIKILKLLLVGPVPPPPNGVSILLNDLIVHLKDYKDIKVDIINTQGIRGSGILSLFKFILLLIKVLGSIFKPDVIALHSATSGLHIIGSPIAIFAFIARKPLLVRKFGGTDFNTSYGWLRRKIIWWVLRRSTYYLAETKQLVQEAKRNGVNNVVWYANSRPMELNVLSKHDNCSKFIFLGQIKREKGIPEIIDVAKGLREGLTIDIFGPLGFNVEKNELAGFDSLQYKGELAPEKVQEVLSEYDALVLPTYHPGEGYPGVILEAYSVGLPVITTRWRAIPEIVDESCGILIEPHSSVALKRAMEKLSQDQKLYGSLCQGTLKKREMFSSKRWTDKFIEICQEAISAKGNK